MSSDVFQSCRVVAMSEPGSDDALELRFAQSVWYRTSEMCIVKSERRHVSKSLL